MKANLSKKVNTINEYLEAGKNRKLIELALTQLNRAWEQLIENHKEFETLCSDDKELQDADTWLLESQAVVEELVCKTVEYQEAKMASGGSVFSAPIVAENSKQGDHTGISKISKTASNSSRYRARAAAREADLAKLKVEQLKEKAQLEAKIAAPKAQLDAQLTIKEAEQEADRKDKEALLLQDEVNEENIVERMKYF